MLYKYLKTKIINYSYHRLQYGETLILAEKGRIELNPSPKEWITEALKRSPVKEAMLSHAIAIRSRTIELPHKDPADRFIAATALENGLILITEDEKLKESRIVRVLKC